MGCDIHMMAEKKVDGKWVKVGAVFKNAWYKREGGIEWEQNEYTDEPYDGRNYKLFAFLADVRNGYGFGGTDTGNAIKPIAAPRGIPEDASPEWLAEVEEWDMDLHSKSWLTVRELLDAGWDQPVIARGVVGVEEYHRLKALGKSPDSWAGWTMGPGVKVINQEDADNGLFDGATHVQMEWSQPIKEFCDDFYLTTLPALKMLGSSR